MKKEIIDDFKSKLDVEKVLRVLGIDYDIRGTDAWINCPWHNESTPSCHINLESALYHCFGCDAKGGDMLQFVKDVKEINFVQTIAFLSSELDIPVPQGLDEIDLGELVRRKLATLKKQFVADSVKEDQTTVYRHLVSLCDRQAGVEYLRARGIERPEMVAEKLSVSVLKDYDEVNKAMLARFNQQWLINAGIMTERANLVFLHHRLMFPFFDGEDVCYLSARSLDNTTKPKYLNLSGLGIPAMYNVNDALDNDVVFLCEGIMDTVCMVGLGLPAVGIAGANNIDIDSLSVLSGKKVILAFDNDAAGEAGAVKLRGLLGYVSEGFLDYVKAEKDILEHALVPGNRDKLLRFYEDVKTGKLLAQNRTATAFGGPSEHAKTGTGESVPEVKKSTSN